MPGLKFKGPKTKHAPVDEVCYCGHLKSQHNPTITPGHGSCAARPCECTKFTWKRFVYPEAKPVMSA